MNCAAIVFVGPGEIEKMRLADLTDSLFHYEPELAFLVIIDDLSGVDWRTELTVPKSCQLAVLPNPRNGRGNWWTGGLDVALATALKWLGQNTNVDFAVRLDTDALVIRPFAASIRKKFASDKSAGLLGTFRLFPNGEPRPRTASNEWMLDVIPKLCRNVSLWRHAKHRTRLRCALFPQHRMVQRAARNALQNGYEPGTFVQGGGYAISGEMIARLSQSGLVASPLAYLPMYFGEDHLATLLCYATGLAPQNFNQAGEVFGVVYSGLCAGPAQLVERGYAIIHSVKSEDSDEELAMREFFRSLRQKDQSEGGCTANVGSQRS